MLFACMTWGAATLAQPNITAAEYFFDNDPGFGNGTGITGFTAATDIAGHNFNADVSLLASGMHTLYVRTRNANGIWSTTNNMAIAKVQVLYSNPHSVTNIEKLEYFYDTDPGYGNGANVPVTAATDIASFAFNADVSGLAPGMHTLYVRGRDAGGFWSMTNNIVFAKVQVLYSNPHNVTNIVKAEYFYDTDPGLGNGTNIPVTAATDISNMLFNADVSALGTGVHTLYVRTRDASGFWSMANIGTFAKVQVLYSNPHSVTNINKAEYYYDTDPGVGNGTDIPLMAATDISGMVFNTNTGAIAPGVHTLYIRTRDAGGFWSLTNTIIFAKVKELSPNPHSVSNIVYAEYFVDTDPGLGNGGYIALTPATDIANINFNVDMTIYPNQVHRLYVRSRDAEGKWSITNIHTFTGGTAPLAVKFLSFDAQAQPDRTVRLDWVTALESNVKHYTIHRSYDAVNWTLVGTQAPAAHSSNEQHTYSMTDGEPGSGLIYYRLTETDLNGKETHAPIRFVRLGTATFADATLYPNPGDGRTVTLRSTMLVEGEVEVTVVSIDGKVYLRQSLPPQLNGEVQLQDMNLPAGSYFINLQNGNQSASLRWQVLGTE